MHCVVTAGPTYETLDKVRRLTNFSTGRLGTELANFLAARGHEVTLLVGETATCRRRAAGATGRGVHDDGEICGNDWPPLAAQPVDAVFHAAAVSDFTFGKIWFRSPQGELGEARAGKISTRQGKLLAELVPTPKVIAGLRSWFPAARLVGWKFEVDGDRAGVVRLAERQIVENLTDACVANGPAYGPRIRARDGLRPMRAPGRRRCRLFEALERFVRT